MNDTLRIALKALDEIDALRREYEKYNQYYDYDFRVAAANVAIAAGIKSRADWTDLLKADPESKYHKWYVEEYREMKEPEKNDLSYKYGILEQIANEQKTLSDTIKAWNEAIEKHGYVN